MSMAVRERRTEIAVLKTLGFSSRLVMGLILSEALLLAALAGAVGIWLASALVSNIADIPFLGAALGQFPPLRLSTSLAAGMFAMSVTLGMTAGAIPAWGAYRAKIVDTLRAA
jgi:putative ABC transport system permease protein